MATGNTLSEVPPPLLDRLEVITLPGYTLDEKVAIAEVRHLDKCANCSQHCTGYVRALLRVLESHESCQDSVILLEMHALFVSL